MNRKTVFSGRFRNISTGKLIFVFAAIAVLLSGISCLAAGKTGLSRTKITMSEGQKKNLKLKGGSGTGNGSSPGQQTSGGNQEKEEAGMRIVISAGRQKFSAVLYDSPAAGALWEKLPLTLDMSEMNGNEKYYFMDEALPVDAGIPDRIYEGDLMLYGTDCLVLFYDSFRTSYRYTPLGRVEDPSGLAQALGNGNVRVTFERADG